MKKPIRVFYSTISRRFFASNQYREKDGIVVITGDKYDVTNDIAAMIVEHRLEFTPAASPASEDL